MFLTYGTAVKRAKRGYDFLWQRGHLYNLSLRKLRDSREQLSVQDSSRCPLGLAHIDERYPQVQSNFHSAALVIATVNRWPFQGRRLDEFVKDHGFDICSQPSFIPDWLHDRQWKLLDRAWKELLELPIPGDIDNPLFSDEIGYHRRVAAQRAGLRLP
jgi:hypothetical protein